MAAQTSAWFVGSVAVSTQAFTTSAGAAEVGSGTYYLEHATTGLSIVKTFAAAVVAAGVSGFTCVMQRDRKIVLAASGTFSITWGSATALRDILGFTGNLSGASTYTATNISALLWSPGYPATLATVPGVSGYPVEDAVRAFSRGSIVGAGVKANVTFYGQQIRQRFGFDVVPIARVWAPSTPGGTFYQFRETVLKQGYRFFFIGNQVEDSASTTAVSYGSDRHGPYVIADAPPEWYTRGIENADTHSPIRFEAVVVGEYD